MDKRYQVFVSSTYEDLQDERKEVIQALLELDCIPSGMELFPATSEDQWTLIRKVIDDCDYYIVVIGGRYGSLGPSGISYTEMEYRYALEQGKPVLAFLHKNPGAIVANRSESTPEGRKQLDAFRELTKQKMVRYWISPADLGSQVSRSIIKVIRDAPAIGWVRASLVPDKSAAEELLRLRREIDALQSELTRSRTVAPKGTEDLAQGADTLAVSFVLKVRLMGGGYATLQHSVDLPWDTIFGVLSPLMMNEATAYQLKAALEVYIAGTIDLSALEEADDYESVLSVTVSDQTFFTMMIQLRALGLVAQSDKPRSVKDTQTYWTLTPYGDSHMSRLRAIHR